jgi:hypothetical protein
MLELLRRQEKVVLHMRTPPRGYWALGFQHRFRRWRLFGWALVTAPLWLIGVFILVRDGLLPPDYRNLYILQFLPPFRWYWHWYVIFVLVYGLGVLLFVAPVANQITLAAERERANKKVRRYRRMRQPQGYPSPPPVGVIAESNIEPYAMEIIPAYRNELGFIIETSEGEATLKALVIPFKNSRHHRSLRRVGDIYDVSGEISWVSWDGGTFALKPGPAPWLSEEREKLPFRRDDQPNRLVLATAGISDYSNLCAAQRQTTTLGNAVREIPLFGDYWRVSIKLHAESETRAIARYNFIFERDGHVLWDYQPVGKPHLIDIHAWKNSQLLRIVLEGYSLLKGLRDGQDIANDHDAWQTATAEFLRRNYDEKPRSKFLFEKHGTGKFARTPSQPASLEDRIGRQIETLDELLKKSEA